MLYLQYVILCHFNVSFFTVNMLFAKQHATLALLLYQMCMLEL